MKYTFRCPECKIEKTFKFSIRDYEQLISIFCNGFDQGTVPSPETNNSPYDEHYVTKMERVYNPTRVAFRGEGFTGAGGTIPKMNKDKREKDLEKPTDVDLS